MFLHPLQPKKTESTQKRRSKTNSLVFFLRILVSFPRKKTRGDVFVSNMVGLLSIGAMSAPYSREKFGNIEIGSKDVMSRVTSFQSELLMAIVNLPPPGPRTPPINKAL